MQCYKYGQTEHMKQGCRVQLKSRSLSRDRESSIYKKGSMVQVRKDQLDDTDIEPFLQLKANNRIRLRTGFTVN